MDVLESTQPVFHAARSVRTDSEAIRRWAATVDPDAIRLPTQPHQLMPKGRPDELANMILLVDSLNFCFFAEPPWRVDFRGCQWGRYYALVASIARAVEEEPTWHNPVWWKHATRADLAYVFRGEGQIPLLDERTAIVNEVGAVLSNGYGGRFLELVDAAGHDAATIARLLAESFPSFADRATYEGHEVWILKRAQIAAADVAVAMRACGGPTVTGMERLTAFADYRLPQALRHLGIMRLEPELEGRIERGEELAAGAPEEVEIRAHTIWAVEMMRQALAEGGTPKDAWLIDEYLWERSHDRDVTIQHHRTRTTWY